MREPNKEYWKGNEVTGYERKQRLLVPRKDEILNTIVDFIPFDENYKLRVIDVGAGQGALSERILARFKQAHVILFDSSTEMLQVAKQRLADYESRFSTIVGDFNSPEWHTYFEVPVEAVASSIALHYLRTECRHPFFKSVFAILTTPGCFINGGAFNTLDEFIQERCNIRMLKYTKKQLLDTEDKDVPIEKLRENMRTESEKAGINRLLLTEQINLLRESGFSTVEVIWRYLSMAVVVGYKKSS